MAMIDTKFTKRMADGGMRAPIAAVCQHFLYHFRSVFRFKRSDSNFKIFNHMYLCHVL